MELEVDVDGIPGGPQEKLVTLLNIPRSDVETYVANIFTRIDPATGGHYRLDFNNDYNTIRAVQELNASRVFVATKAISNGTTVFVEEPSERKLAIAYFSTVAARRYAGSTDDFMAVLGQVRDTHGTADMTDDTFVPNTVQD